MSVAFAEFTEQLIPISDFSQGKAGKIFSDVAQNNKEYIVLKNNQPTAVVISVEEYRRTQNRIAVLEKYFSLLEDYYLQKVAESRKDDSSTSFEEFVKEEGFSMEDIEKIINDVEFE